MASPDMEFAGRLSTTIGAIYDCALDPGQWETAIAAIKDLVQSHYVGLHFFDFRTKTSNLGFTIGAEEPYKSSIVTTYGPMWALLSGMERWQIARPYRLRDVVDLNEFENSRFYREWVEPQGSWDYLGMVALRNGSRIVLNSYGRLKNDGNFSEQNFSVLKLIAPHIVRMVNISDVLDLKTLQSDTAEAALNSLSSGVILLAGNGKLIFANRAAEAMFAKGNHIRTQNGDVSPVEDVAKAAFQSALAAALPNSSTTPRASSVAMVSRLNAGAIANVLPVQSSSNSRRLAPFAAKVAIFVQEPNVPMASPLQAFADLYSLTPSEHRVLAAMMQGHDAAAVSDVLGSTLPTVRSHIKHTLEKTGTSRQADLLSLVARSMPPSMV